MMKTTTPATAKEIRRVAAALPLLSDCDSWKTAAAAARLSPTYFQRLFKRTVGVSPRQYVACRKLASVKKRLAAGQTVLDTAFDEGFSGGGRVHDLFISIDATTPGEYASAPLTIRYGLADSPFGRLFVAATARGICSLKFLASPQKVDITAAAAEQAQCRGFVRQLQKHWRHAVLHEDTATANDWARRVFYRPSPSASVAPLPAPLPTPLHVRGTNFQIKVWQALLAIPAGSAVSYGALARAIGSGSAARAVGAAAAANPVAVLIPCHRLLSANGALNGYAWGLQRKRALLAAEFAAAGNADDNAVGNGN